jgi:hypothetical protein
MKPRFMGSPCKKNRQKFLREDTPLTFRMLSRESHNPKQSWWIGCGATEGTCDFASFVAAAKAKAGAVVRRKKSPAGHG